MHTGPANTHLDLRAFARRSGELSGREPVSGFARVAQECRVGSADPELVWAARGEMRANALEPEQVWLHLTADTVLGMTCQRCLDEVRVPVAVSQWFRFVADEETAAAQDDAAQEDLLVLSDDFDLHALIEDEILLALPLIARHTTCPKELNMSAHDPGFDAAALDKPNPFAALAQIRPGKGGDPD